jgi:hypothetical protein
MARCTFAGNADFYGIGIRIGFYLQWFSGLAASHFAPSEAQGLRFAMNSFTAATFLALLIVTVNPSLANLQVVEVYIVLLLTFGAYVSWIPLYLWRLLTCGSIALDPTRFPRVRPSPVYGVLSFLLHAAVSGYEIWFWSVPIPKLRGQACEFYGFLFARISLDSVAFQAINIGLYTLLSLVCVYFLFSWTNSGINKRLAVRLWFSTEAPG